MADVSNEQLKELIARATSDVLKEMQSSAGEAFSVDDLRAKVLDFDKIGDAVAWEVHYKTSMAGIEKAGSVVRPGAEVAWEVHYKTSMANLPKGSTQE
ncbi:hypothetical protein [Pseudomonas putida]|uniref:hypothetical protein n=1 Tax=Pseudomonas putida TaxID=303 RepID=UPI00235D3F3E|nr:hypothetical protein [Pseudomonas putida]GLO46553.1 hypothetical protein PPUN109347_31160 [Pseudomonas putida]HDS0979934.1 hypothetical protein [Pseudomonas putida]